MKIIHASIKGDIMDASIGQAVATACGMAGLNAILHPAFLIGLTVCTFLAGDLATRPALTQPPTLRTWVEGGTQHIVASIVEAATLAYRHTGVTTEHEARITDTALTAGGFTALGGREAWATHRAGVATELVVAVGRTLKGTEVWLPPFSKLGPGSLTCCHIGGYGRTEASWMSLNLTGIQQARLEVLRWWHKAMAGC